MSDALRILVIGAHPDDCELKAGGVSTLWRERGDYVKFVSVTNGESGHHRHSAAKLLGVRKAEAEAVTKMTGIQYEILDNRDGRLEPTIAARKQLIALIRREKPDLILTHRPNDYHPDHRATSTLVADASYMLIVPNLVRGTPALRATPHIMYLSDNFQRPTPFTPSVVVDVEPVFEQIIDQLACHKSQFCEWLPYTQQEDEPQGEAACRDYINRFYAGFNGPLADRYRDLVVKTYGADHGAKVRFIEAFEPCEYGPPLDEAAKKRLFPFLFA